MAEAERVLEVLGVPPDVEDELLVLYFENRRRSGGGPVQDCRRRGTRAILTFESPEDAERVLSKPSHSLQETRLAVRLAALQDYTKVLLRGLHPQTDSSLLELYMEWALSGEGGRCAIHRSPAGDQALVQLPEPLSNTAFLGLEERVGQRLLDGALLAVERVQHTDSILVQSRGARLSRDLLELYFESARSGGGSVQAVRVLAGDGAAIVCFQDWAAVLRVLEKPHRLQDTDLDVSPYYDFLDPPTLRGEVEAPLREAVAVEDQPPATFWSVEDAAKGQLPEATFPEWALQAEEGSVWISGEATQHQQLQLTDTLQGMAQELLPLPAQSLSFLQRADVQEELQRLLASQSVVAGFAPCGSALSVTAPSPGAARQAISMLHATLSPFCLPVLASQRHALASPRWEQLLGTLRCCTASLAPGGEHLQGLALRGWEQEGRQRLQAFLQDAALDESLVAMEPGLLRYLQLYYQELLAGVAEVTMLPLEGSDVSGFRLSGEAGACRAAAEFLQSLLGTVSGQQVTLRLPGVARFLLDEGGQRILRELESRFQCAFGLEQVHWSPPFPQEPEGPEGLDPLSCCPDPLVAAQVPTRLDLPDDSTPSIEEIKGLLAALEPGATVGVAPDPAASPPAEVEADLYTEEKSGTVAGQPAGSTRVCRGLADGKQEEEEEGLCHITRAEGSVEEEAQLLLAIQQSMDSQHWEEEELQRATELSLRSYQQEQCQGVTAPVPDPSLQVALEQSLEEALSVAGTAQLTIYAAYEQDVSALLGQLERALLAQQSQETVESEALRALPSHCRGYLAQLQRQHAVRISLQGATASVQGFAAYAVRAARALRLFLQRLQAPTHGNLSCPPPAWRQGHQQQQLGRPLGGDSEDSSGPPAVAGEPGLEAELGEEVKLVPLAEGSGEFRDTVRRFYDTLEDFHNKIRIVKVEKLLHPLLYRQYQLKRLTMEKAHGHQAVEQLLFHGTTQEASREICQHGFNRSFCGRNATLFGQGVYFAVKAVVSVQEQYSPRSPDGSKYIFMAKVLTGEYTTGSPDMRAPPLKEAAEAPLRYDSVVDNPRKPAIFVIFNDTQAYPQYLITCQLSKLPAPR